MNKIKKTFSLNPEVVKELETEPNQSLLINSYLRYYFSLKPISIEELLRREEKTKEQIKKDEEIKKDFKESF